MMPVCSTIAQPAVIDWSLHRYSTEDLPGSGKEVLARRAAEKSKSSTAHLAKNKPLPCLAAYPSDEDEAAEAAVEAAAAKAAVKVTGRGRLLMTNKERAEEKKAMHAAAEKKVEKGCCQATFGLIAFMAKNHEEFIELCSKEASKGAGFTNLRKQLENDLKLNKADRGPYKAVEKTAWTNRPIGCESLKKALLLYGVEVNRKLKLETNQAGFLLLKEEFIAVGDAIKALNDHSAKSHVRASFPEAGGFLMQQKAASAFRAETERLAMQGKPRMTDAEKYQRWPCLQPGWPDNMEGRLTREELEIRRLETGKRGLLEPDAPVVYKKAKNAMADAREPPRAASPSLALPLASKPVEAPSDEGAANVAEALCSEGEDVYNDAFEEVFGSASASAPAIDRRFDAEPPRAAPVTAAAPEEVQAHAALLQRDPHDLSDFDPEEVARYKKTVLLFDPVTRRPRTPTIKDLLAKGLKPVLAEAPAPSAKALGKRPMK